MNSLEDFRGCVKGMLLVNGGNQLFQRIRIQHHPAHNAQRMYLCGCAPAFRVGAGLFHAGRRAPKDAFKGSRSFLGKRSVMRVRRSAGESLVRRTDTHQSA